MNLFGPKKKKIPAYVQALSSGSSSQRQDAASNLYKLVTDASDLSKRQEVAQYANVFGVLLANLPQIQVVGNILECLAADAFCAEQMVQTHAIEAIITAMDQSNKNNPQMMSTLLRIVYQLSTQPSASIQMVLLSSPMVQNFSKSELDRASVAHCCGVLENLMAMNGDHGACRIASQNAIATLLHMTGDSVANSNEKPLQTLAILLKSTEVEKGFLTRKDLQRIHLLTDLANPRVSSSAKELVDSLGPNANTEDLMVLKYMRKLNSSVRENQQAGLDRLSKIAASYPNARHDIACADDALAKKIMAFWKDGTHEDQQNASSLLNMLIQEEQTALQLVSAQLIATLITLIQEKKERSMAFDILQQLASLRNRQIKWSLVEADVIPFMISYGMKRKVPMGGACMILQSICHENEENRLLMAQNGGILFLFRCLQEKRGEFAHEALLTMLEVIKSRQVAKMVLDADGLNKTELSVTRCANPKVAELWRKIRPDLETIKSGGTPSFEQPENKSAEKPPTHRRPSSGSKVRAFADQVRSAQSMSLSNDLPNSSRYSEERQTQSSSPRAHSRTRHPAVAPALSVSSSNDVGSANPSNRSNHRHSESSKRSYGAPIPSPAIPSNVSPYVVPPDEQLSSDESNRSDQHHSESSNRLFVAPTPSPAVPSNPHPYVASPDDLPEHFPCRSSPQALVREEVPSIDKLLQKIRTGDSVISTRKALDLLMQTEDVDTIQQIMDKQGSDLLLDCWNDSEDLQIQQKAAECLLLLSQYSVVAKTMVSQPRLLLRLFRIIEQEKQCDIALDLLIILLESATDQVKKEFDEPTSAVPKSLLRCINHRTPSVGVKITQMVAFLCYNDDQMKHFVLKLGFFEAMDRLLERYHHQDNNEQDRQEITVLLQVLRDFSIDDFMVSHLVLMDFATRLQPFCHFEGSIATLAQEISQQIEQKVQSQRRSSLSKSARRPIENQSESLPLPSYDDVTKSIKDKRPESYSSFGPSIQAARAEAEKGAPTLPPPPQYQEPSAAKFDVVVVDGKEYRFDRQSNVLDGRNSVFKCMSSDMFSKARCLKIYECGGESTGHDVREVNSLKCMQQANEVEAKRFLVQAVAFGRSIVMNNENTTKSALVMELGKRNLKEMIQDFHGKSQDQTVPTMKKIAECVDFIHRQGFVYGDLKLENVVNFGEDFPEFKLVDFENCCRVNQPMPMDFTADYCPPEMAVYAISKSDKSKTPRPLLAEFSFDSWCFGVLWMKYSLRGNTLMEFQYSSPQEIVRKLADPDFSFDRTLKRLSLSFPVESLVRRCLSRDPLERPNFKEILKSSVLRGFNTTLYNLTEKGNSVEQNLVNMKETMVTMLRGQERLIWQVDQITLPILWVLVPWQDQPDKSGQTNTGWKLSRLVNKELELRMICDGAFDDSNNVICCACPEKYRIKIKYSREFLHKCIPVLKAASLFLKLAGVGGMIVGLPGLGVVGDKLHEIVSGSDVFEMIEGILKHMANEDFSTNELNKSVDELINVVSADRDMSSEIRRMSQESIQAMKSKIRHHFVSSERQQSMRELLEMADPNKDWRKSVIIGGLERVRVVNGPNQGTVHWVCANHARCPQYHEMESSRQKNRHAYAA